MAKDKKRIELVPVDDDVRKPQRQPEPVIRLGIDTAPPPSERVAPPPRSGSGVRKQVDDVGFSAPVPATPSEAEEQVWGSDRSRARVLPWGWLALIAAVLAGAVLWSLAQVGKGGGEAVQQREQESPVLDADQQKELAASEAIQRLQETAARFVAAATVEDLKPLVRQPERVYPLMQHYYQTTPFNPTEMTWTRVVQPITLRDGGDFWHIGVNTAEGKPRNLLLEIDPSGEARVDWETVVCYQPMEWDRYALERPAGTSMDFRVNLAPDYFYSHEFADSKKWRCYRLTARDSEQALFGYVTAGSELAAQIDRIHAANRRPTTALILRLLRPEGIHSRRGVVIEKLLNSGWTYVVPPAPDS